ncbi:MAG: cytidine deaminase [Bacilli bacterium]|nr:cytidine deaminase [Bacilli bacterium]
MEKEKLVNEAIKAMSFSYSPYSKFKVGAAVLIDNGEIFLGANIENASYSLAMCAERNAVYNAYCHGYKKDNIKALAIVAATKNPCAPCGACRQVLSELLNEETPIYLSNLKGDIKTTSIKELLPYMFDKADLNI